MNLNAPGGRADANVASGGAGSTATTRTGGATSATGGTTASAGGTVASTGTPDAAVGGGGASGSGQGSAGQGGSIDPSSTDLRDGGLDVPSSSSGGIGGNEDAGHSGGTGGGGTAGGTAGKGGSSGGTTSTGGTSASSGTTPDAGGDASSLLTGLVVYYRFESANGTDLPDNSGNNNTGKLGSGPPPDGGVAPSGPAYEFVTGKVGNALALHKAGYGYVRVPSEVFAKATELTVALWVKVTTEQGWQRILDVGVTPNPYQFNNTSTGTKYFNIVPKAGGTATNMLCSITSNGYSNEQTLSAPSIPVDTWTHIALVFTSGAGARLYINGAEAAYSASVTLRPVGLGTIDYAFIGKSIFDADPPFDGIVDCFRVYNRALSASEVSDLFNYTIGP